MKKISELLIERNNAEKGCLMAQLPMMDEEYQSNFRPFSINKDDIYDDDAQEFGIEMDPHITILYGLESENIQDHEIEQWIKDNIDGPIECTLREVTMFENDDKPYDVVKWDIDSEGLTNLNNSLRDSFPYTNDFPDYHPHATVMYANKGTGKNYKYMPENPMNLSMDILQYSKPTGQKLYFKI